MRRSRKPLSVVRRIEGSNPSPSAFAPKPLFKRVFGLSKLDVQLPFDVSIDNGEGGTFTKE
jgi:hypothetical protein